MKKIVFNTISEFSQAQKLSEPENPLFSIGYKTLKTDEVQSCIDSDEEMSFTNRFYLISLKNIVSGEIIYGRTKYDCNTGTLLFSAPDQEYIVKDIVVSSESWFLAFHEDYIHGLDIRKQIKNYGFFNYNVNEALHLSPKEEQTIKSIFNSIEQEYRNNQDEFSKEIIISHLETLLKYSDRFYKRQFLNREALNVDMVTRFKAVLNDYFESGRQLDTGIPSVEWVAEQLGLKRPADCWYPWLHH